MYINTRRHSAVVRVDIVRFIFVAAGLFLCQSVFAQHASTSADHDYLVRRCVERALSDTPETSVAVAGARCEELERQIDAVNTPFAIGDSWKVLDACGKDASKCTSPGPVSGQTRAGKADMDSQPSRFAHIFNAGSHKNDCIGLDCLAQMSPQSQWQYDSFEMQRRFRNSTVNGTDYVADLIYPGFGRFERKRQDFDFRLDFLNPHRCGKLARVGMCLSLTML